MIPAQSALRTEKAIAVPEARETSTRGNVRVLNVTEDGRIAGPQLRMMRVAVALADRVDTTIAIPDRGSEEFRERLEQAGLSYVELPLTKLSRSPRDMLLSNLRMPGEIVRLARYIRREGFDVVHSSGGAWMFKPIIAARLAGVPSVWHLNDTSSPAVFRTVARLLCRRWVAGVIVAGSRVREYYLPDADTTYAGRFQLISIDAPVDTERFRPASEPKRTDDVVRIVTVGNVNPVKDYVTVVRAAAKLKERGAATWQAVGFAYDSQRRYREMIAHLMDELGVDNLDFTGSEDDVASVLAQSDIYVCSSAAEASPTAVWEAMAAGLPIVSTDVGCVRDHVQEGTGGYLVPVGDHAAMATAIGRLIDDPELRRCMGEHNRKIATERLDISVCADRHEDIYETVRR